MNWWQYVLIHLVFMVPVYIMLMRKSGAPERHDFDSATLKPRSEPRDTTGTMWD